MITLVLYILFVIASYLLGAIPFMILISRARGVDISHEPDLHQAMWYKVGRRWGLLAVLLDILKGVVPILAGLLLQFPLLVTVLAGLAAVCGQMWPVFRKFDGERGNTTGGGMVITLTLATQRHPDLNHRGLFCDPGHHSQDGYQVAGQRRYAQRAPQVQRESQHGAAAAGHGGLCLVPRHSAHIRFAH